MSVARFSGPSLAQLAKPRTFGMNTFMPEDVQAERIIAYHAGLASNSLTWNTLQPTQGSFSFTSWNARRATMIANDQRGLWHTGVWHVAQPGWLATALAAISPANATSTRALITAHFEGVAAHAGANLWPYQYFTAVNEVTHESGFRTTNWLAAYGNELYIDWAFIEARRLWPQLRLVFNDSDEHYGGSIGAARRSVILGYLTAALGRGVPINVLGLEGHLEWGRTDLGAHSILDTRGLATFCQAVATLGLDVMITELDCGPASNPGITAAASEAVSARLTREYVRTVADNCNLIGVILWDWTDRYQDQDTGADWFRTGLWDRQLRLKRNRYDAVVAGLRANAGVVPQPWYGLVDYGAGNASRHYTIPHVAALDIADGAGFAWGFFARVEANSGPAYQYVVSSGAYQASPSFTINLHEDPGGITPNKYEAYIEDADGTSVYMPSSSSPGADGVLRLVVVQYNVTSGWQMKFCVPGQAPTLQASVTEAAWDGIVAPTDWHVGTRSDLESTRFWKSELGGMFRTNRLLTDAEIQAIAAGISPALLLGAACVEAWPWKNGAATSEIGIVQGITATRQGTGWP